MARNKKIKVAIVAASFGQLGGPEIAVKNLVEALAKRPEADITLFAPADWRIKSKHIPTIPQSLWRMKNFKTQTEYFRRNLILENILKVTTYQDKFDIVHLNSYRYAYAVATLLKKPCVLTLHSRITSSEFGQMRKIGIQAVALSRDHKKNFPVSAVISNGIDIGSIEPSFTGGKYLITAGRLVDNKGVDLAIKIARKTGKKLLIFGRIGNGQERREYFRKKIKPFLNKQIVYMGEASQKKLFAYLRNAEALLFPIRTKWGSLSVCPLIVMESLACGTPVIGCCVDPLGKLANWRKVACLSKNISVLARAVSQINKFDRKNCRAFAEKHFDIELTADKYIKLYQKILKNNP